MTALRNFSEQASACATTRDQRIRDLTNARHWTMRGLTAAGDQRTADLTWAALLADVAHAEVVGRLERMGVTE